MLNMRSIVGLVVLAFVTLAWPALAQDLVITDLTAPPSAPAGTPFDLTVTVENQGTSAAGAFVVKVYADTSAGYGSCEDQFGRLVVDSLAAGASLPVTFSAKSPGGYGEDVYYLVARVDTDEDVVEADETNNTLEGSTMTFLPAADLVVRTASVPASAAAGGLVTLRATIANEGFGETCSSDTGIFLSDNDQVTSVDTWVHDAYLETVPPAEGQDMVISFVLPENIPLGTTRLGILADSENDITELDETNNGFTAPFEVRAASGRLAFVSPPRVVGVNHCSPAIRVQMQDMNGNPRAPTNDTRVSLIQLSSMQLYADPYCSQETDFTVIDAGSNVGTFYLEYDCGGAKTVIAAAPELVSASQTQLVTESPDDGATYLEVSYAQRSKRAVVGQAVEFELKITVLSEAALENVTLRPEQVGLNALSVDGVPLAVDDTVVVGTMEPGDQRSFVIEAVPDVGRLSASSMVVTAFQLLDSDSVYEVVSPEVDLVVSSRNQGLAECSSTGSGGPAALLLVVFGMLLGRRRQV